tara:strand:- start:467 stop:928 length:462 start_codon:yes stop_codon:yes gene_type:complete
MIKTLVTDIDGVMTDGGFYYTEEGKVMKKFGPHDNDGIKMLREAGIEVYAITADKRGFPITEKRLNDMNVPIALVSESERLDYIKTNFGFAGTAFVGDGWHDAESLQQCELGFAPQNATPRAISAADHKVRCNGGEGVLLHVALTILNRSNIL